MGGGTRLNPNVPLAAPWSIGSLRLAHPVVMAPMAGVTDLPYRLLAKEQGAALTYSELISAKGLVYGNVRSLQMVDVHPDERPVGIQIFGGDPAVMAEAARIVAERGPDLIDINMGCPVPKVTRNDEGCALMKDPERAARVARAVVEAVDLPVTVKIRKGWDADSVTAVEVAQALEEAGVAAIAVHGRTRSQMYSGRADWDIIAQVKDAVRIPVIGNGDVASPEDAARMLRHTGCDAVMIGRACLGNPWIFGRTVRYLREGVAGPEPTVAERVDMALRHLRMAVAYRGEKFAIPAMRKHLAWYLKGVPGANAWKAHLHRLSRLQEIEDCLLALKEGKRWEGVASHQLSSA